MHTTHFLRELRGSLLRCSNRAGGHAHGCRGSRRPRRRRGAGVLRRKRPDRARRGWGRPGFGRRRRVRLPRAAVRCTPGRRPALAAAAATVVMDWGPRCDPVCT